MSKLKESLSPMEYVTDDKIIEIARELDDEMFESIEVDVFNIFTRDYKKVDSNCVCPDCNTAVDAVYADPGIKETLFTCEECIKQTIYEDLTI